MAARDAAPIWLHDLLAHEDRACPSLKPHLPVCSPLSILSCLLRWDPPPAASLPLPSPMLVVLAWSARATPTLTPSARSWPRPAIRAGGSVSSFGHWNGIRRHSTLHWMPNPLR